LDEKNSQIFPIFIAKVNNFSLLFQLLQEIAIGDYEIKITNNEQIKIQFKSSIAYVNNERVRKQRYGIPNV